MSTYGEIRFRLSKLIPGVDLDLLDGWIQDRYQQILDRLDWKRLEVVTTLSTEPEYTDGTVDVTGGNDSISGSGTNWLQSMDGWMMRINAEVSMYSFTYVSQTSGTLDRPYEGQTASGLSYRLTKNVYALPADMRALHRVASITNDRPLERVTPADLDRIDPARTQYGSPRRYAVYMDTATDPPAMQIEFHPAPVEREGFRVEGIAEEPMPTGASITVLPWVRPGALIAGVQADAALHAGDGGRAALYEAKFESLVRDMANIESRRRGPQQLRVSRLYTDHNLRRLLR